MDFISYISNVQWAEKFIDFTEKKQSNLNCIAYNL